MKLSLKFLLGAMLVPMYAAGGEYAATVNRVGIPSSEVEQLLRSDARLKQAPEGRKIALDSLINGEVVVQAAKAAKLDKSPEVKAAVEAATRQILANAVIASYLQENPVSESAIKSRYDDLVRKMPKTEYRVRHILLKTRNEAEDVLKQLADDKPFAELASRSQDAQTAKRGGELGWIAPSFLVPQIAERVQAMKPGDKPALIETAMGFDVLEVMETRPAKPPKLDAVHDSIRGQLQQEAAQAYVAELRSRANIKLTDE